MGVPASTQTAVRVRRDGALESRLWSVGWRRSSVSMNMGWTELQACEALRDEEGEGGAICFGWLD